MSAIERAQERWQAARRGAHGGDGAGAPPGGPPGDLDARIKRLEEESRETRGDLKKLLIDAAEIKGRIASMPTSLQLFMAIVAVFVASGLLRWFGH